MPRPAGDIIEKTMRNSIVYLLLISALPAAVMAAEVTVAESTVQIPTYVSGPPDPNPLFYTGRTYQGAKGMVYPYPMYDNLTDRKEDRPYTQVCLENEYVKVCVLPQLGGRIFEAVDKTNGYNFFYKQSVIKPALIGMIGAWISGGVEWNIPHHHRASSFLPVLHKTQAAADGSKTVWIGELELRDRMRWVVGLTLRPGSSVLEAQVSMLNTTPVQNSVLYFANVAVHTNGDYQVIFPPRTQFATQHAKREFARWPIADSVYNGIDFTKGVDVSMWKNHPSAISMFAWNDTDDWLAGYDHGKHAGTLHVADRHQVPGKKFFTWGTGPSGRLWDKILSDADGPYLELMVGAWSDNQPDYSWMQPYETKTVKQYWYPFRDIGGTKSATREAAVNLDVANGKARVGFAVTRAFPAAVASLTAGGREIWTATRDLNPATTLTAEIDLPAGVPETGLRASLRAGNRELVAYQPVALEKQPLPPPVTPPAEPEEIKTTEELYLTGLRLEQFHSPALEPDPYYEEALRRDPFDIRNNVALGILNIKRGRFGDAEKLLRAAAGRVERNYTRARDGDALYYLGLALKFQGKLEEAENWLQRAAWCHAWQSAAYLQIAEIQSRQGRYEDAIATADRALVTNAWNTRALSLKALLQLHLRRNEAAAATRALIRGIDPIDAGGFQEITDLLPLTKSQPAEGLELAVMCLNAGLWREAEYLLDRLPERSPLIGYFQGWLAERSGKRDLALTFFKNAAAQPFDLVFPFQIEAAEALRSAMQVNPSDSRAPYYLGLLLFDRQPEEAVRLWEKTVELDPSMAIAWRNLSVAYARQDNGVPKAVAALEKAVALNGADALYLFELDRLYEFSQAPIEKRLALFQTRMATAEKRDDAMSRVVTLLNLSGRYDDSIAIMEKRHFHLWEGGARFNVQDAWTDAHLLRGHRKLAAKDHAGALKDYLASIEYPENLEVTRAYRGSRAPEAFYFAGLALGSLGRTDDARKAWRDSAAELIGTEDNPHPAVESGAVLLYYQALSLAKLGESARAQTLFRSLIESAKAALQRAEGREFFAKFGERQSPRVRAANAHYVAALGHSGLGQSDVAKAEFAKAVDLNPYLLAARARLSPAR